MATKTRKRLSRSRNIPLSKVAEQLGMSPSTLRNYCRNPDIPIGEKIVTDFEEERWVLSEWDMEYISQPENLPVMGRPPVDQEV